MLKTGQRLISKASGKEYEIEDSKVVKDFNSGNPEEIELYFVNGYWLNELWVNTQYYFVE